MFKAFLKKVEETTDKIGASLKIKENAKPLDTIIKETITQIPPIPESIKKGLDIDAALQTVLSSNPPANHYKENIDLHPGAVFVKKYQEKLNELHTNNLILARKAEAVDRKLPTLVKHCTNHLESWKRLQGELARLPELSANVSNIRNQIDFVLVKFDELEVLLSSQVEGYHANELAKYKERVDAESNKYQAQKQKELASLEEELATTRAKYERDRAVRERDQARILRQEQEQQRRKKEDEEREQRRRKEEEERQQRRKKEEEEREQRRKKEEEESKQKEKLRFAFGGAFQHQLEQFKKFGAPPVPKAEVAITPLESIVPEDNVEVLEEFLKDGSPSADRRSTLAEEDPEQEKEKEEKEEKEDHEKEQETEQEKELVQEKRQEKEEEKEEEKKEGKEEIAQQEDKEANTISQADNTTAAE